MDMLQQLKERYRKYEEQARKAVEDAPRFAGFWGMGDDPRRHHCHDMFYEDVQQWVLDFLNTQPDGEMVLEASKFILGYADECREMDTFWYAFAAQSHVIPMFAWMNKAQCKELADWYDTKYTKLERLPAQRDMYKKLRKAAKG